MNSSPSVSVVIPVLNAEGYLPKLLPAILSQQPSKPMEIILVDSISTDKTCEIATKFPEVKIIPIENFSHGRARNLGAKAAKNDIIALLTQDALPKNEEWLSTLLAPFSDEQVVATFSRQTPYPNATPMERYFLNTHFPDGAPTKMVKTSNNQELAFQRDVFFSNFSSAIRRNILLEHPFDEELIMSEDQQFARDVIESGYAVVYQPQSVVIHSHRYTLKAVFKRYFDSIYSLTILFKNHNMSASASMGLRYLFKESLYMLRHHPLWLPNYFCYTCAKTLGTITGHFAKHMPTWLLKRLSMHSYHWKKLS